MKSDHSSNSWLKRITFIVILITVAQLCSAAEVITGEKKVWHKITLTVDGPSATETEATFKDYRMTVTFTSGATSYTLSGYFAADGDAANTSATSGTKWRCHFRPDAAGTWTYKVSFLKGADIAMKINSDISGSTAEAPDGATGTFDVGPSDKTGKDFRNPERGLLRYVNKHHLKFSGSDRWFIRGGPGIPENLMAYGDFDGAAAGSNTYSAHLPHYTSHPGTTWKTDKGKAFMGMINYLADQGANTMYAIMCNINGDGKDVWPYTSGSFADAGKFDVSKLEQWDYVITHMNDVGIAPLLLFLEKENETALNAGSLWKLFYREVSARFGHHLGVTWVFCEEMNQTPAATVGTMADWLAGVDGYKHLIGIHTPGNQGAWDFYYVPLANKSSMYACMQTKANGFTDIYSGTKYVRGLSDAAGKSPWVVGVDEARTLDGTQGITTGPAHDTERKFALWGNLMAGGAGVSMYGSGDNSLQDFTPFKNFWNQCGHAIDLMWDNKIPLGNMSPQDNLVTTGHCIAQKGHTYVIQLLSGGTTSLDLTGESGEFKVSWLNPKDGGGLKNGTVTSVTGGGSKPLGSAPGGAGGDWVILVRSANISSTGLIKIPQNKLSAELQTISKNPCLVLRSGKADAFHVAIYDAQGHVLASFTEKVSNGEKSISLTSRFSGKAALPQGLVLLKIRSGNEGMVLNFMNLKQ